MELALVAGGVAAVGIIVLADRVDDVVNYFITSDDPLTDFDADLEDDSPESLEDA